MVMYYLLIKQEQEQLSWFITLIENLWLLQPSVNRVAEVSVQLNNSIEVIEVSVGENKYGTYIQTIYLDLTCVKNKRLLQKTKREF
jgi:hypothetical protein